MEEGPTTYEGFLFLVAHQEKEFFYALRDLISIWMESTFLKISMVVGFSRKLVGDCEYKLPMKFCFHILYSFCAFSNSYMLEIMLINQFLNWLHWKCDYTWGRRIQLIGVGCVIE